LEGGTIRNGTIAFSGSGSLVASSSASSLENLILEGDTVISGNFLSIRDGLTVNGTIEFPNLSLNGDETFDGTGTIVGSGTSINTKAALTLTIGSGLTVEGDLTFTGLNFWEMSLVNLGTIRANIAGRKIAVGETRLGRQNYVTLDNQGALEALDGGILQVVELLGSLGTVSIQGASSVILDGAAYIVDTALAIPDTGTLTLNGGWDVQAQITNEGTFNIGGELTLTEFSGIATGSGAVILSGILDLEEGTLTLDDDFGELPMKGGTIKNGTITISGSGNLNLLQGAGRNVLENIVLNGPLTINQSELSLSGGLTLNGTLTMENNSILYLGTDVTIDGTGSILFSNSVIYGAPANDMHLLTIGNNITLDGNSLIIDQFIDFLNLGTIRSTVSGESITFRFSFGGAFENQGSLEALDGAILDILKLTGNGIGNATLGTGSQLIVKGDLTQSMLANITNNGGNLKLQGNLDLESGTLNINDAFGEMLLDAGTIKNGTVAISGTGNLNPLSGTLENVTLEGEMLMKEFGGSLLIRDGLTLNGTIRLQGPGARIGFDGDETINGTGKITFETTTNNRTSLQMVTTDGELTIGSGITLEGGRVTFGVRSPFGGWGRVMDLVNLGTIRANVAGQTITFDPDFGSFDNQGTLEELNGGTIVLP